MHLLAHNNICISHWWQRHHRRRRKHQQGSKTKWNVGDDHRPLDVFQE